MKTYIILPCYLLIGVLFYLFIRPRAEKWEIGQVDAILLSLFWPLFLLFAVDWGFGNLIDKATGLLFRKKT